MTMSHSVYASTVMTDEIICIHRSVKCMHCDKMKNQLSVPVPSARKPVNQIRLCPQCIIIIFVSNHQKRISWEVNPNTKSKLYEYIIGCIQILQNYFKTHNNDTYLVRKHIVKYSQSTFLSAQTCIHSCTSLCQCAVLCRKCY